MSEWNAETAEWYAQKYGEYATNRFAVESLDLAKNLTVVDIGCGTGSALRHASDTVTHGRLIGIDPVPRMIEIAREQTAGHHAESRIEYFEGNAEQIPLADDLAEVVFAFDSIDHWCDRERGLAEVCRVLCPDGRFVIVKDGGTPGASKSRETLVQSLNHAGLHLHTERTIKTDDVVFNLWVCTV